MGYERKRGKLADLNSFLRGRTQGLCGDLFSTIVGDTTLLRNIKYVITLDTDTKLPRDAAWQLVGTMAHPLNQPRFDETKKIVYEGYGILQPRVEASYPGEDSSLFVKVYGGESGIDPVILVWHACPVERRIRQNAARPGIESQEVPGLRRIG